MENLRLLTKEKKICEDLNNRAHLEIKNRITPPKYLRCCVVLKAGQCLIWSFEPVCLAGWAGARDHWFSQLSEESNKTDTQNQETSH